MKTLALSTAVAIGSMFNQHDHPSAHTHVTSAVHHTVATEFPPNVDELPHRDLTAVTPAEIMRRANIMRYIANHRTELENR